VARGRPSDAHHAIVAESTKRISGRVRRSAYHAVPARESASSTASVGFTHVPAAAISRATESMRDCHRVVSR
jgi:hypothetical protein